MIGFVQSMSTVDVSDVIDVLGILANERNLRVTVSESLKGGLLTGATTVVGGLLGGPVGLAIGSFKQKL